MKRRLRKKRERRLIERLVDGYFKRSPLMERLRVPQRYRVIPGRTQ